MTKTLFDQVDHLSIQLLMFLFFSYLGLTLLGSVFQYLSQCFAWYHDSKIQDQQRQDLMDKILNGTYDDFIKYQKEEYLSIFSNDIQAIQDQYFVRVIDIF